MIYYLESSAQGNPVSTYPVSVTRMEAITVQREAARSRGYEYASDEEALLDFIAIHWAWEVEDE